MLETNNKDPLKHFPFYCNQYLGILLQYTAEQRGVFISLLALYISEDGLLPKIEILVRRLALFEANANQMLTECLPKVKQIGDDIILAQKKIREKRREAGKLGGKSKNIDDKQKVSKRLAKGEAMLKHTETETDKDKDKETNTDKDTVNNNPPISPLKKGEDKPKNPKRFIKPTIEQIKEYCKERNNGVDAEKFLNYYESNGWRVGKNPMKSWQAAVRTWERNKFDNNKPKGGNGNDFGTLDY